MPFLSVHFAFDALACVAALAVSLWQRRRVHFSTAPYVTSAYLYSLLVGAILGGYGFGTGNLWIGGRLVLAHSILGALVGAIIAVEIYKAFKNIHGSTGANFALPFCATTAVGRIGCFLTGLSDETVGIPTNSIFGYDFGDGILRHPVQLYETAAMMVCAGLLLLLWRKCSAIGYEKFAWPLTVGFYGVQRFVWEFLKPYATLAFGLNLFQFLCLGLMVYAVITAWVRSNHARTSRS